jgi:uncharacterized protein YbjQ (UPF0145 family)
MSAKPLPPAAFSCGLTVDELLLITNAGWDPLKLVTGDCTFDLGNHATSRARSQEMGWISDGLAAGQARALTRLQRQAAEAGADGVVGIAIEHTEVEVAEPPAPALHHFTVVGTAVRRRERPATRPQPPFTSHLSGQDTWTLMATGAMPLGLVSGFSVYHSRTTYRGLTECSEMTEITDAVYNARELAMRRMQTHAAALNAKGIIGVQINTSLSRGPTVTFTATGTAITTPRQNRENVAPRLAIDLIDPAPRVGARRSGRDRDGQPPRVRQPHP